MLRTGLVGRIDLAIELAEQVLSGTGVFGDTSREALIGYASELQDLEEAKGRREKGDAIGGPTARR